MATIVKRKDRYHVVHDYINNHGERKQKWKSFKTKREALTFKNTIESADNTEKNKQQQLRKKQLKNI